jgi:hypothetical protein
VNVWKSDCEETVAETRGNGEVAPKAVIDDGTAVRTVSFAPCGPQLNSATSDE